MKRIKMMLLSLALVAVVGGALAFKANFNQTYCTGDPNGTGPEACEVACPASIQAVRIINSSQNLVCTTTYDNDECTSPNLSCTDNPVELVSDIPPGK